MPQIRRSFVALLLMSSAMLACDSGPTDEGLDNLPPDVDMVIPAFQERGAILYVGEVVSFDLYAADAEGITEIRVELSLDAPDGWHQIGQVVFRNIHGANPFVVEGAIAIPNDLAASAAINGEYVIGAIAVDGTGRPYGELGSFDLRLPE